MVRMRAFSSARHGGGFEETASQWVDGRRRSVSSTEGSEEAGARTGGRTRPSSFACQAGNQVDKRYGEYSKGEAERRERRELGDGAAGWKMQAPGLSRGSAQSVGVQCPGWLADGRLQLAAVARGELRSGAEVREGTHLRCWHQQRTGGSGGTVTVPWRACERCWACGGVNGINLPYPSTLPSIHPSLVRHGWIHGWLSARPR